MPNMGTPFPIIGGDSVAYYELSQNLFHSHIFTSSPTLIPDSLRMPGYPFFLYIFNFLPHPLLLASLAQMILGSVSVVLTYLLGKKFLSEKVGFLGALLFSIEPTSLLFGVSVMSDTLSVFALLLSTYLLLLYSPNTKSKFALLVVFGAGLLFGYSVLIRVIVQYLAPFLLLIWLCIYRKELRPYKLVAVKLVLFVVGIALVIAPWALRNHRLFNTYTLSATPYINVTQFNFVHFYAYQHHLSIAEAQPFFSSRIPYPIESPWFSSLVNEPIFKQIIRDELSANFFPYLWFHLVKTIPFFVNDGLRDFNRIAGVFPDAAMSVGSINFTDSLLKHDWKKITNFFLTPQPNLWMLLVGSTVWVSISILWIAVLIHALVRRTKKIWFILFASGVICYFAFLSSPVIQPRYRMPAAPFMLLLAAEAGVASVMWLRRRATH